MFVPFSSALLQVLAIQIFTSLLHTPFDVYDLQQISWSNAIIKQVLNVSFGGYYLSARITLIGLNN
jgi:hypothetical protein